MPARTKKKAAQPLADVTAVNKNVMPLFMAMEDAQKSYALQNRSLNASLRARHNISSEEFYENIFDAVKRTLTVERREASCERLVDFLVKLSVSGRIELPNNDENADSEQIVPEDTFAAPLLDDILAFSRAKNKWVRMRVCTYVAKILGEMSEDEEISDEIYESLQEKMLVCCRDKIPMVRVQAVRALFRLQDPSDPRCPVITEFTRMIGSDSSHDVRQEVLDNIALTRSTLPMVIERTKDLKHQVRVKAFEVLAEKVPLASLSITSRASLALSGLQDRHESVREACGTMILNTWYAGPCEGSLDRLVNALDIESNADAAELVVKYVATVAAQQRKGMLTPMQSRAVGDLEFQRYTVSSFNLSELSSAEALIWRITCQTYANDSSLNSELEHLLPPVVDFCTIVEAYAEIPRDAQDVQEILRAHFVLQQLFLIAKLLDLSDEAGRRALRVTACALMADKGTPDVLLKPLVSLFRKISNDQQDFVRQMNEVIICIQEAGRLQQQQESNSQSSTATDEMASNKQNAQKSKAARKRELESAALRLEIMQLQEALDDAKQQEDYMEAAKLKEKLTAAKAKAEALAEASEASAAPSESNSQAQQDDTEQAPLQLPAKVQARCLVLVGLMLQHANVGAQNPVVQSIVDDLVLTGLKSPLPRIRRHSIETLGLLGLIDLDFAREHLPIFIQAVMLDSVEVQKAALQSLFDFYLRYGSAIAHSVSQDGEHAEQMESLMACAEEDDGRGESMSASSGVVPVTNIHNASSTLDLGTSTNLLGLLCKFFDVKDDTGDELQAVAVEGFAKLFFANRVASPAIIERLMLLYFSPTTEDAIILRQCLSAFWPAYAFSSSEHQRVIGHALIPTLQVLLNSPKHSPLYEINAWKVAQAFVSLTSPDNLIDSAAAGVEDMTETSAHSDIAMAVLNHAINHSANPEIPMVLRVIPTLNIMNDSVATWRALRELNSSALEEFSDANLTKYLSRFGTALGSMIVKYEEMDEEVEGVEPPMVKHDEVAEDEKGDEEEDDDENDDDDE
eukprot:Clim_evm12s5 gene=Clim_evmTU12s5